MSAPYMDLTVLGAILYRMHQFDRAALYLNESIAQFPSDRPIGTGLVLFPQLLLAMIRWQYWEKDESRRLLDENKAAIDEELQSPLSLWQRRATLEVLRQEAEDLIERTEVTEAVRNESPTDSRPTTDD